MAMYPRVSRLIIAEIDRRYWHIRRSAV